MAKEKVLTGTLYWLGNKFGIDPTILRIAFAIGFFFGGVGLMVYFILWIVKIVESNE